jgi:uncharacterized caspase-like protein
VTWVVLALWPGTSAANERRVALVVGVSNYKHAPALANTINDARATADALKRVGFEVEQLLDPDRAALETAVRKLRYRAQSAEASLFYYAGHALELGGRNWLLPVGADVQTDRDLRFEGLDLDSVLEQIEGTARISLVFLDACRDNPFRAKLAAGTRDLPTRGLARITPGYGTLVAFATAPGTVAQDGTGPNSPFTTAMLKLIERPGLELRRLLAMVRAEVRETTQGRQIPWENSSLESDFYFRPAEKSVASPVAAPPPNPPSAVSSPPAEIVFWNSISASRDPEDYRAYLAQFPQGVFAGLARNRLTQLQVALAPASTITPAASEPATVPPPSAAPVAAPSTTSGAPLSAMRAALLARLAELPERTPQSRDELARNYELVGGPHKALAFLPGTTKDFRAGRHATADLAEERVLEACQFHHRNPCALLALDDKVQSASAGGWARRNMPRVAYEGLFDPEWIPVVRTDVLARADVKNYRAAPAPKAAAFHAWGRLFVITASASQRAAEEDALAACNADSSRNGADGPCYLYAVGNKVILPQRLSRPRAPAETVGEALAAFASSRTLAGNYAAESPMKALAIEPETGRSFHYHSVQSQSNEVVERASLEACQLRYAHPCILIASNDDLRERDPLTAERRDMPRVRYSGAYQTEKVPMLWSGTALDLVNSYPKFKGHKAMAIRPGPLVLFVYKQAKSAAEAERKALAGCNALKESAYPCFVYAVDNTVILPQRRTEASR